MTLSELYTELKRALADFYDSNENQIVCRRIVKMMTGHEASEIIMKPESLVATDKSEILEIVKRIKNDEPLEYIFNSAQFLDLELFTESSVLIPRPETEELAVRILDEMKRRNSPTRLLDIGTGSGCIPIYLKNNSKNAEIMACDISEKALETAKKNAAKYECDINFFQCDILDYEHNDVMNNEKNFDIIVSNPPYVLDSEKALMRKNVLDYEPHNALFVPDNDPLVFYRTIARFASKKLNNGGKLYFEINEQFGTQTLDLLAEYGFSDCHIYQDLFGKNRMAEGSK